MHHGPSPSLAATLRALHGETDGPVVAPALGNWRFARILALAPDVDPVVGAPGALAGGHPGLLAPAPVESPAFHAAVAALVDTDPNDRVLKPWADIAPAGLGASHAAALIDVGRRNRCKSWAAGALI